jgi:hypothetical protein
MTVLSIDVGIKNLSYCLLDNNGEILDWKNICVCEETSKKLEVLVENYLLVLMEHFTFQVDDVIIENQPMLKNGLMKTLSVVIYTYFNMLKVQQGLVNKVAFISATNKLKCKKMTETPSKVYKERKKQGIQLAKEYLTAEKLEWLNAQKKQDDLCDAFLAGMYFLGF